MQKIRINNVCAGGLLVKQSDPSRIFVERKFNYPSKAVDGRLCPPGGNWFGEEADVDETPRDTFVRELVQEELSFRHDKEDMSQMGQLDRSDQTGVYQAPEGAAVVTEDDVHDLEEVKSAIRLDAQLFGAYLIGTQGEYFRSADPTDKRANSSLKSLAYYFIVPLSDDTWARLERLQEKFGNLSNESQTLITSLDEMLKANATETDPYKQFIFGWAHGWAVRDYFLSKGYPEAERLVPPAHTDGYQVLSGERPMLYSQVLARYDVEKKPPKYEAVNT